MFDWAVVIPLLLPLLISLVATAVCYRRRRYGDNNPRVTRWLTVGVPCSCSRQRTVLWTPRRPSSDRGGFPQRAKMVIAGF